MLEAQPRTTRRSNVRTAARPGPGRGGQRLRTGAHHPHGLADSNRPGFAFGLLAVTFTNKAAREMLARMSSILPIDTRGLWIGTFHGLCNRMLRAHHRDAGLPQSFQILDVTDQLAAIKRLMKTNGVDDEVPAARHAALHQWRQEEGLRPDGVEAYATATAAA